MTEVKKQKSSKSEQKELLVQSPIRLTAEGYKRRYGKSLKAYRIHQERPLSKHK